MRLLLMASALRIVVRRRLCSYPLGLKIRPGWCAVRAGGQLQKAKA